MFSAVKSPYTFDPMTSVFCEPMFLAPESKKRRCHKGPMNHSHMGVQYDTPSLEYKVDACKRGYVLSLSKKLNKNALRNEINRELAHLKEQLYKPSYHFCQLLGGLVEEQPDEELLLRQAMAQLNTESVCRKLARNAFRDYKIELNHRGDELAIMSRSDGVAKEFDLGVHIDDLEIVGCQLDESCRNAVCKILLVEQEEVPAKITVRKEESELQQPRDEELAQESESEVEEEEERPEMEVEGEQPKLTFTQMGVNFRDQQPAKNPDWRRRNSPIMEEVEDAEASRFRQLVRRAPTGNAILEDF